MNEYNIRSMETTRLLFDKLDFCSRNFNGDLTFMDEDRMRCHVLNCLGALRILQIEKSNAEATDYEMIKRKVFAGAVSMMIQAECESDQDTILTSFPDDGKLSDERSWLPMHFAMPLSVRNVISEEDVYVLHATNPLAMRLFSEKDESGKIWGYTPIHLLCMQKRPNMSLVRDFCLRDPKAFLLCTCSGKNALHICAQHSESLDILQSVLQIDHILTTRKFPILGISPLALLCNRRSDFPSFHEMFLCLIAINSTVQVINDGVIQCINQCSDSSNQNISLGSPGDRILILLGELLNVNTHAIKYKNHRAFHLACICLSGEMGIAVLSLLLSKDSGGIKSVNDGLLPIHHAAEHSSLDVIKFLVNAYPDSLTMIVGHNYHSIVGSSLLHLVLFTADADAKVEYLCNICPALVHVKCSRGLTPLHRALQNTRKLNIESVKAICKTDEAVVRDICYYSGAVFPTILQLPLHLLIRHKPPRSELSDEGDLFRLFLRLYPASAGIKDGQLKRPYDLAISGDLSVYFIRLLLSADPSVDTVKRHNLNFAARREGMFLAFIALSTNREPIIWAKIRYQDKALLTQVISFL